MDFLKNLFQGKGKTGSSPPGGFEVFYNCDECLGAIKDGAERFNCVDCVESYDLCRKCYESGKADEHTSKMGPTHTFVTETQSRTVTSTLVRKADSLEHLILNMFRLYSSKPAVGQYSPEKDNYVYLTFSELFDTVKVFGSGLNKLLHDKNCGHSMVSMCSVPRLEWYLTDLACLFLNVPTVPLGSNSNEEQMRFILKEAEVGVVVCSGSALRKIVKILPECPSIRLVVFMDFALNCTEDLESCSDLQVPDTISLMRFTDVLMLGRKNPTDLSKIKHKPTDIYTVLFTSGSTGEPKGCVFQRKTWHSRIDKGTNLGRLNVWLSFHPPSHSLERSSFFVTLLSGGRVGIFRGSMEHLFDDFALVRPTVVASTPRLWTMLYNQYIQELHQAYIQHQNEKDLPEAAELVHKGDEDLSPSIEHFDVESVPAELKREVMSRFRSKLGGREHRITTGGAPTGKLVKRFIIECFEGMVNDGYGSTEVGGIFSDGIGLPHRDIKLVDVPEMGYFTTDYPPRGEICVKTPDMIDGYFKRPDITAEKFVDGYFHTGDIGIMEPNDKLRIIDRKKNIFKLAQGEFVSPERLELLYTGASCYISQMYVYGNTLQTNVVAVVVPEVNELLKLGKRVCSTDNDMLISDLCHSQVVREFFMEELQKIAKENSLPSWEIPIGIHLEPEPFTVEGGLLTSTLKKSRPKLEQKYKGLLEDMYDTLSRSTGDRPLEIAVFKWIQETLNGGSVSQENLGREEVQKSFNQLGGDSLSATHLSSLLKEHLSLEVPVNTILKTPLAELVANITNGRGISSGEGPPLASASVDWIKEASTESLGLDIGFQPRPLSDVPDISSSVLLTGCTGFLGRFILWELLLDSRVTQVFCLAKKRNDLSARDRVIRILDQLREEFQCEHITGLEKLMVVEGDLSEPRLALSAEDYSTLCERVDTIIHNGASVNHILPYQELKSCNVESTIELIRIAITSRSKFFHYVSTIGVFSPWQSNVTESVQPSTERLQSLTGYSQSKWVSESLVLNAISQGLIMGNISRPGLIGPHGTTGHANLQDWVHWLVKGVLRLGLVPTGLGCDSKVIRWIPVEQVARAVTLISLNRKGWGEDKDESNIFHLVNSDTPVKFSTLTDALVSAHHIEMTDYREFRRELRRQSRESGDQALVSLDLLLPAEGGWPNSSLYFSEAKKVEKLRAAGIHLGQLSDTYVLKYLHYLNGSK